RVSFRPVESAIQLALRQLGSGAVGVLRDDLTQHLLGLFLVAQAQLDIGKLVERVGHLGALRVGLTDFRNGWPGALRINLRQVDVTQPVLCITGVAAFRVATQESRECLTGLVEVLRLDQVEGGVVIQLFLFGVSRLAAGASWRHITVRRRRRAAGVYASGWRIRGAGCTWAGVHQTLVEILVTLQSFLLQALNLILLLLEHAAQLRDLALHLLQLHEEHALRRRRSRSSAPGAGTAITRPGRRIPRSAHGA